MSIRFCRCAPDAIVSCIECAADGVHEPAGKRGPLTRGDRVWVDPDPRAANFAELRPRQALCTAVTGKYVHVNYGYGQYRGFAVDPDRVRRIGRLDSDQQVIGTHNERYWSKG